MCAIAGIQGESGSVTLLQKMTDRMAHRGPDGSGLWNDESKGIYLGHRRLSIVDLEGGAQPMESACGRYVITFNGEIYNHRELRSLLEAKGREFATSHSDTEVLLQAFAEWGEAMLEKLNGMWAFAIYDRKSNQLFLARDRFGKKPLYYYKNGNSFAFASELTALTIHPEVSHDICQTGMTKFFAYGYIPAPHTAIKGVKKLPAAHWMRLNCNSGEMTIRRYWRYQIQPDETYRTANPKDLASELSHQLTNSINRRLIADVPVGVFLSGGVDSSAISALARHAGHQIETFSIGFDEASFDESSHAQTVSDHLGTNHHCEKLGAESVAHLSDSILQKLDEPLGDSSLVATSLLCQFAQKKCESGFGRRRQR